MTLETYFFKNVVYAQLFAEATNWSSSVIEAILITKQNNVYSTRLAVWSQLLSSYSHLDHYFQ